MGWCLTLTLVGGHFRNGVPEKRENGRDRCATRLSGVSVDPGEVKRCSRLLEGVKTGRPG